jgi:hypothetical protein
MADNLMDGLFSEMNRVRESMKDYEGLPNNAGQFALHLMKQAISNAEASIRNNDVLDMLQAYQSLKEFES